MSYTTQHKLDAINREIAMRQKVYPRWVDAGKMSAHKAEWELGVMRAIAKDYEARAERERGQHSLFH